MPRPRFTLRWLMVAVALVGLTTASFVHISGRAEQERLSRVAASFRMIAAEIEARLRRRLHFDPSDKSWDDDRTAWENYFSQRRPEMRRDFRRLHHYEVLASKYARAARYPWLPVAPDPPEPE